MCFKPAADREKLRLPFSPGPFLFDPFPFPPSLPPGSLFPSPSKTPLSSHLFPRTFSVSVPHSDLWLLRNFSWASGVTILLAWKGGPRFFYVIKVPLPYFLQGPRNPPLFPLLSPCRSFFALLHPHLSKVPCPRCLGGSVS